MKPQRSLKRRLEVRPRKKKLYLFSEGENTEPLYFKAYERLVGSSVVEVICEKERGTPRALLDQAKRKNVEITRRSYVRENGSEDEVWIVFDEDEHPFVPEVLAESSRCGIHVAYSNPCFEVWLILHAVDYDRDEHRHDTQRRCEQVSLGYSAETRKVPELTELMKYVGLAEQRAEAMGKRREADGGRAPQTSVHKLIAAIRG